MTKENKQPGVAASRMALFQKIGAVISANKAEDVVAALADHIGQAVAFCCDTFEEADAALDGLIPEIKSSMRVNWHHSREAQDMARRMQQNMPEEGKFDA